MSSSVVDLEKMLRDAVNQAKATAPRAADDLRRCASEAGEAIAHVTNGAAALELIPLNLASDSLPSYQLQLRRVGSEAPPSDLEVYRISASGYPVERWYSRRKWEEQPNQPDGTYHSLIELEGNYRWMVSDPKSRLVALVAFFEQRTTSSGA